MNLYQRLFASTTFAVVMAPIVLAASACGSEHAGDHSVHNGLFEWMIEGDNHSITQVRDLASFNAIQVNGSTDVEIQIGSPQQVSVSGDDNLVGLIDLRVDGNRLVVSSHGSYRSHRDLKVTVQMPALEAIDIAGSGDVAVHGIDGGKLKLQIAGSGDISGDGKVDELALHIFGSGDARLHALSAKSATVEINGSGDASVTATESIDAVTNGSGDIGYDGNPQVVHVAAHGSGDIHKS